MNFSKKFWENSIQPINKSALQKTFGGKNILINI